jgi:ribonuclease HI
MNKDKENSLLIFTDGSSLGNPGPGGWGALLAYPKLDELVELGGSKPLTTNNEMELMAIVSALSYSLNSTSHVYIYTDSQYAINGITKWMYGWSKNGWKTAAGDEIKNKGTFQTLYSLVGEKGKDTITFEHVRGHVGIPGNERVDDIARELAEGVNVSLYRGTLSGYPNKQILIVPTAEEAKKTSTAKKTGKAFSYLSLVDDVVQRHATWPECESRVKGVKAKFKKALSKDHEEEILREWGIAE